MDFAERLIATVLEILLKNVKVNSLRSKQVVLHFCSFLNQFLNF